VNPKTRTIISESLCVAKTAIYRMQTVHRTGRLDDPLHAALSKLSQACADVETIVFNTEEDKPDEHPLVWALRTGLRDNPELTDLQIAALVRQTLKEGWKDGTSSQTKG
jgi:hypothetical protein